MSDVLRLGKWQDALAGVECDALIVELTLLRASRMIAE